MNTVSVLAARWIRAVVGSDNNTRIVVVPGCYAPKIVGESGYWETPGGKRIHHPGAYKWPKVYMHSTLAIEVGSEYVANLGVLVSKKIHGVNTILAYDYSLQLHGFTMTRCCANESIGNYVEGQNWSMHIQNKDPRKSLVLALNMRRDQLAAETKAAEIALKKGLPLTQRWLTAEDALRSGSCEAGTAQAQKDIENLLQTDGPIGAIRADFAIEALKDRQAFVTRALAVAAH